ncbi:hypothetical protein UPYG_G00046140 [Umbra pygmaea]|uniref:Centlein n=1 Tax=Umbra pygmaea TaxID=75934 RepID=A0ABD0XR13_UMBPY
MNTRDSNRIILLEEEVKNLSEELVQCQADKEFVWSLWKRLQAANPDLTQAVSLVVEREKLKAERKDRKVLEILQTKDYKIQELEQMVTGQQQEITNLLGRKLSVDKESGLLKEELAALRYNLGNKSQELKDVEEDRRRGEEALKEQKEGLEARCSALQRDLEEVQRQEAARAEERSAADAKVKEVECELSDAKRQAAELRCQCSSMAEQLLTRQGELAQRDQHVAELKCELQELHALYRQSSEHAAEQAQLIQQLEALSLDTQRVLLNQEEAHTADTSSYQKLYNELSVRYQALQSNEGRLQQSHDALTIQLGQREQHILQLHALLKQQHLTPARPYTPPAIATGPPAKQTNAKHFEEQTLHDSPDQEPSGEEKSLAQTLTPEVSLGAPDTPPFQSPCLGGRQSGRRQSAPVQRSRSLSPASSMAVGRDGLDKRVLELEELLRLKMQENEELRSAHNRRHKRLRLIQTNYRAVKQQLREVADAQGLPRGRAQDRAEPWQLRQENSDAVWKELAYFKRLNKKLTTHSINLEEELDLLRVQAAMDQASVQELRMCLQNEKQELLYKVAAGSDVKSSTPKKPSHERVEQSLKKMEQLEARMVSMEQETERLLEDNEDLRDANRALTLDRENLQASLARLRAQGAARVQAAHAQALVQGERHRAESLALEARLEEAGREKARTRQQLLKLRRELGILKATQAFQASRTGAKADRLTGPAGGIGRVALENKVKFKTSLRPRGSARPCHRRALCLNRAIREGGGRVSPSKDDWEDMSADSDGGDEYSDSLDSYPVKSHRRTAASEQPVEEFSRTHPDVTNRGYKQHEPGEVGGTRQSERKGRVRRTQRCGCCAPSSLRTRVLALQRHLSILQSARRDSQRCTRDLRGANEKMRSQLALLTQRMHNSKQLSQKLTSELAGVEGQKRVLEMELQQWRQIHRTSTPQQPPSITPQPPDAPGHDALKALETEVKQLQTKLKSSNAEVTRQALASKSLRAQLQEKEEKLRELQEKVSHAERDVHMKRQLVEDVKTRMKFLQETEKTHRGAVLELENRVKTLTEEARNRKALVDSLKRRLNVATKEKSQYESTCQKLKDDLEKKDQRMDALQARLGASEHAQAELAQTASHQMEGLAQQSTTALGALQRQLSLAHAQLEQLQAFARALAGEVLREVVEVKSQLRKRRKTKRLEEKKAGGAGRLSKQSIVKAQSIAASILNMTETDLADMLDTDEEADDVMAQGSTDQEWLGQVMKILQEQIPSAALLMEVLRLKMKERKLLTEELAVITTAVSENG